MQGPPRRAAREPAKERSNCANPPRRAARVSAKLASIPKFGPEIKNRCTQEGLNVESPAVILKSGPKIKNRCSRVVAFPYKCGSRRRRPFVREGVRESLADLLRQSLTAKSGNKGCWSGCYGRSVAENITDRRASSAFCMDSGIGIVGRPGYHRPKSSTSA